MFVNEIPQYRQVVLSFYSDIKGVTPCNREDFINKIQTLLDPFKALFKKSSVLENLYSFIDPHVDMVKNALFDYENCRTDATMRKLEQVAMALSKKKTAPEYVNRPTKRRFIRR
ncbi:plexin-B-like [Anneissia japonica]|uniref:plexin-B-like n=1 Tax=Anneissia japonica TaxID=1529436 RepID=UPI001425AC6F|nr:plexin-B-like [Anneissia japonica]